MQGLTPVKEHLTLAHSAMEVLWEETDLNAKLAALLGICSWDEANHGGAIMRGSPCLISWKEAVAEKGPLYKHCATYPRPSNQKQHNSKPRAKANILSSFFGSSYNFDENEKDLALALKKVEILHLTDAFVEMVLPTGAGEAWNREWDLLNVPIERKAEIAAEILEMKLGNPLINLRVWEWANYPEGASYENYSYNAGEHDTINGRDIYDRS